MKYRSFVALEIPPTVQAEITNRIYSLTQKYPKPIIKWVKQENIHLTLRFLADRTCEELDFLARSIQERIRGLEPFRINFSSLGTFPNSKIPRVIWIGIDAPFELIKIQGRIEEICNRFGLQKERRHFSPHITLGRINDRLDNQDASIFQDELSSIFFGSIESVNISEIVIFKSDLRSTGPVYTALHKIPIGVIT